MICFDLPLHIYLSSDYDLKTSFEFLFLTAFAIAQSLPCQQKMHLFITVNQPTNLSLCVWQWSPHFPQTLACDKCSKMASVRLEVIFAASAHQAVGIIYCLSFSLTSSELCEVSAKAAALNKGSEVYILYHVIVQMKNNTVTISPYIWLCNRDRQL